MKALGKMVVGNLLTTAALRFGDREAFTCVPTGRRFTFRETNDRCNRLANALLARGLTKGDRVAFLLTNRVEVAEIYFALAKSGLVGIPLNYRLAPPELFSLMRDIGAVALISEDKFADVAERPGREEPRVRIHVVLGEPYESLLAAASPAEPGVEVAEEDPFYFNLTSGTTGLPKCYVISQYNSSTMMGLFQAFDMRRDDVAMTVFPMFGRVGFAWVAGAVMYGARNVLDNFDAGRALATIAKERVTIINLVPTMGSMLLARPEVSDSDTSSMRALVLAGSLLPPTVREGLTRTICPRIYEYYGMQETGPLTVCTPEDRRLRADSVGRPLLFSEVAIVDAGGAVVAPGTTGEIVGRGPGTICGYFQNEEKTAEAFRAGWLHTGDLGCMDDDGFLFINGRIKDLVVTGGQNVHAGEVEATLLQLSAVGDCAVIGLPDPLWGESVTAVVVRAGAQVLEEGAVIAWCRTHLAGFKTPKRVLFQEEPLPRTATGKVQKLLLVERYKAAAD